MVREEAFLQTSRPLWPFRFESMDGDLQNSPAFQAFLSDQGYDGDFKSPTMVRTHGVAADASPEREDLRARDAFARWCPEDGEEPGGEVEEADGDRQRRFEAFMRQRYESYESSRGKASRAIRSFLASFTTIRMSRRRECAEEVSLIVIICRLCAPRLSDRKRKRRRTRPPALTVGRARRADPSRAVAVRLPNADELAAPRRRRAAPAPCLRPSRRRGRNEPRPPHAKPRSRLSSVESPPRASAPLLRRVAYSSCVRRRSAPRETIPFARGRARAQHPTYRDKPRASRRRFLNSNDRRHDDLAANVSHPNHCTPPLVHLQRRLAALGGGSCIFCLAVAPSFPDV